MSLIAEPNIFYFPKKVLKKIIEHWTPIGVLIGLISSGFSLLSLYAYTRAINRPDLFMYAIDAKSSLVVWLLINALLLIAYLLVLGTTTWLFGIFVSFFPRKYQRRAAVVSCIPISIGFATLIGLVFFLSEVLSPQILVFAIALEMIIVSLLMYSNVSIRRMICFTALKSSRKKLSFAGSIQPRKNRRYSENRMINWLKNNTENLYKLTAWLIFQTADIFRNISIPGFVASSPRRRKQIISIATLNAFLIFMLFLTTASSSIPVVLLLESYLGADTQEAARHVAAFALITLLLTLAPVLVFYWVNGNIYNRLSKSAATLIAVLVIVLIFLSPGSIGAISYGAAAGLDIRQREVERFLLSSDVKLSDLDAMMWQTKTSVKERVEILGFQLFLFGDVLLICPAALSTRSLRVVRDYTSYCIRTKDSKTYRKPKRPVFASNTHAEYVCAVPKWRIKAGALLGWKAFSK